MEGKLEAAMAQESRLREELGVETARRTEGEETLRTERETSSQRVRTRDNERVYCCMYVAWW